MNLAELLSGWRENNRLEFKRAQGGFPRSFWETYSAFANTEGGIIVLGVEEAPDGPKLVGVPNAEAMVQDLWNGLNSPLKVSANLLVETDVAIEEIDGASIVIVKVPRADRSQRPVYINNSMNAGTYRRNGEGDYRCTKEVVSAMVRDNVDGAIDKEPLDEMGLDALSDASIGRYRNEFATIRVNHPWTGLPREEFLLRLGAIGRSPRDGGLHPTKAGLLMFGEAWRITDEFPNYFLDCRQVGDGRRWDNRITSDSGDWSGNVFDFWNRASLMLCEGLPRPFGLGSGLARIDDTPQHEAIREGLTNALVHADYYGRTGVVAIRRRETVEFSNPGCLRLPLEVVEGGGVSDPRNKTLMTMFNLIGKGDKAGSGFDVFRRAAEYARVPAPELSELLEPDRTKLTLHVEVDGSRLGESADVILPSSGADVAEDVGNHVGNVDNGGNHVGNHVGNVGNVGNHVGNNSNGADKVVEGAYASESDCVAAERAANSEELVLACIKADQKASAGSIAAQTGLSMRQVERVMKRLRESGRIERIDGTRGYWEVKE